MSAIAERAGACIGSLYQFFPNKGAIAQALRTRYLQDLEELWTPLESEAADTPLDQLIGRMVDSMIEFVDGHPAFLALLDAPAATRAPEAIRKILRRRVAGFFQARRPHLSEARAQQLATVTLAIMKALNQLYAQSTPQDRRQYIPEFKSALYAYLSTRLEGAQSPEGNEKNLQEKRC
jgi:AcrR family transcriptional regulator